MVEIQYGEVVREPYSRGACVRNDFPGFKEDYLVLHSLIRRYAPKTFIEVGTSTGSGTNIICQAMEGRKVYSIDVPPGTDPSIMYPGPNPEDGHPDRAGKYCKLPYEQLFGFSGQYDYSRHYPLEGWFIDAKHDYLNCKDDTLKALAAEAKLIIWHDMQIRGVDMAANEVIGERSDYDLYRVDGTRMAYAVKKEIK